MAKNVPPRESDQQRLFLSLWGCSPLVISLHQHRDSKFSQHQMTAFKPWFDFQDQHNTLKLLKSQAETENTCPRESKRTTLNCHCMREILDHTFFNVGKKFSVKNSIFIIYVSMLIGLEQGTWFVSCCTIFCEICFVEAVFVHEKVAEGPEIKKLKKTCNFSHKILCLGHEIILNVNWHVLNLTCSCPFQVIVYIYSLEYHMFNSSSCENSLA